LPLPSLPEESPLSPPGSVSRRVLEQSMQI